MARLCHNHPQHLCHNHTHFTTMPHTCVTLAHQWALLCLQTLSVSPATPCKWLRALHMLFLLLETFFPPSLPPPA